MTTLYLICAECISQADVFTRQFGAAREPELSRKAWRSWFVHFNKVQQIMVMLTGAGVSAIIVAMSIYMIVKAN